MIVLLLPLSTGFNVRPRPLYDLLVQRAVQTCCFTSRQCRDNPTAQWLEQFAGHSGLEHFHGLDGLRMAWDEYLTKLLYAPEQSVMVQSVLKKHRGLSPNNPYLQPTPMEYEHRIVPSQIAERVMQTACDIASEWTHDLGLMEAENAEQTRRHLQATHRPIALRRLHSAATSTVRTRRRCARARATTSATRRCPSSRSTRSAPTRTRRTAAATTTCSSCSRAFGWQVPSALSEGSALCARRVAPTAPAVPSDATAPREQLEARLGLSSSPRPTPRLRILRSWPPLGDPPRDAQPAARLRGAGARGARLTTWRHGGALPPPAPLPVPPADADRLQALLRLTSGWRGAAQAARRRTFEFLQRFAEARELSGEQPYHAAHGRV